MIDRFTRFLGEHRGLVLVASALVIAFAIAGVRRLDVDTDFDVFMPSESVRLEALRTMSASFGDSDQLLVLARIATPESDTGTALLREIRRLPDISIALEAIDGVAAAQSPIPPAIARLEGAELMAALNQFQAISPGGALVEHEGSRYAVFRVLMTEHSRPQQIVEAVRDVFGEQQIPVVLAGEPYLQSEVYTYVYQIVTRLPPIALILILLVFRLRIGSFLATGLSLLPAVSGAIITLGAIGWTTGGISIMSALVPVFVIVIGSADGLHVTSHVIDRLNEGKTPHDAVAETLKAVGIPVILTTLTTMVGFLSLTLINSVAINELGVVAAGGVLIAGIATWVILPTVLLMIRPRPKPQASRDTWTVRFLSAVRGAPAIIVASLLLVVSIPGALRLQANFSMIDVYKPTTEIRQNLELASDILGGAIPVYVTFDHGSDFGPTRAEAILQLQDRAVEAGIAGRTVSVYSLIRDAWTHSGAPGAYPPDAESAEMLLSRLPVDTDAMLSGFRASDGSGRAVFFLPNLDDATLRAFEELAAGIATAHNRNINPVGTAFIMKEMNDQIINQQLGALLLAVSVTFLLIAFTQRSLWTGFLATVPILITLIVMFGVMGYAGIALSVITAIMSGLTIGVGIDYSIHYVSLLRYEQRRETPEPSRSALRYVATPVLANALGLAIGFTAMAFSPMQIHVTLSVLMWVTMLVSAALSLTLLPTIEGIREAKYLTRTRQQDTV